MASSRAQHEHGLKERLLPPLCGARRENENLTVGSQAPPSSMTGVEVGGRRWKDNLADMCLEEQVDSHSSPLASSSFVILIFEFVLTQNEAYIPFTHISKQVTCLPLSEQPQVD